MAKKSKNHDKAIETAYSILVSFRKLVEERPSLETYTAEEIEDAYKNLWCETMSEEAPWK